MARTIIINPYSSVRHLANTHRLHALPKPRDDWRLIQEPYVGEIHGLPRIRGAAVATNGIIVAVLRGDARIVFGHLAFFVPDHAEDKQRLLVFKPKEKRLGRPPKRDLEEFV